MKLLWCWRCKMEVPMLDDDEFKRVMSLRGTARRYLVAAAKLGEVSAIRYLKKWG